MFKLVKPNKNMESEYWDYIKEWKDNEEKIFPSSVDPKELSYDELLEQIKNEENANLCPKDLVPASTYFLVDKKNRILGAVNIRHELNDELYETGGHIGYGIRPSEREKGFGKQMLKLALEKAREIGIEYTLITCARNNIGSAKVIEANGGIFENEVTKNDIVIKRYWIDL